MRSDQKIKLAQACAVLGYSRQVFYRKTIADTEVDYRLADRLKTEANLMRSRCPTRGCRTMYESFGKLLPIGRDKTISLLMDMGYRVRYRRRYGQATKSGTRQFPNLLIEKTVNGINQVWQSDMAHYLYGDRKYYTIYITDVYSQEVIGYGAFSSNEATNYGLVLKQAIKNSDYKAAIYPELIHHSDGGKQYESVHYSAICKRHKMKQSMCMYSYENPYAEKTNDLINNGYLNVWRPASLEQLKQLQRKAVLNHNTESKKAALGKLSPAQFKSAVAKDQFCKEKYELKLRPRIPEQPRKRQLN